jgi:hypothetical protein
MFSTLSRVPEVREFAALADACKKSWSAVEASLNSSVGPRFVEAAAMTVSLAAVNLKGC